MRVSLITSGRVLTPAGARAHGWVRIADGRIAAVGTGAPPLPDSSDQTLDAGGRTVAPGLIDVHVHGGAGHESMDADPDGLREMARFHARHGVTSLLPTTWTATREETLAALEAIRAVTGPVDGGATILGAHMEGPYLNAARKGAHRPHLIRPADQAEATELLDSGVVRMLALAPEVEANHWLVDECVERGITVAAGHTDATYEQIAAAVRRGVTHVTHVFNGMRGLHHREPGAAGAALALDGLHCELIADGVHVAPPVIELVWRAKGPDRLLLVTDTNKTAGLPDGEYRKGGRTVHVRSGDAVRLDDGTISGSTTPMAGALHLLRAVTGAGLEELWPVASRNPALAAGVGERKGAIEVGKDADLVVLDDDGQPWATVAEGCLVHQRWSGDPSATAPPTA